MESWIQTDVFSDEDEKKHFFCHTEYFEYISDKACLSKNKVRIKSTFKQNVNRFKKESKHLVFLRKFL